MSFIINITNITPEQEDELKFYILKDSEEEFRISIKKELNLFIYDFDKILDADWYNTDDYSNNDYNEEEEDNILKEFNQNLINKFSKFSKKISLIRFLELFNEYDSNTVSNICDVVKHLDDENINIEIHYRKDKKNISINKEEEDDEDNQGKKEPTPNDFLVFKPELFC